MMLNDFPTNHQLEVHRDDETTIGGLAVQMNPSLNLHAEVESTTHLDTTSSSNIISNSNNSTSSSTSNNDLQVDHLQPLNNNNNSNLHHQEQQFERHQHHHQERQSQYFIIDQSLNYNNSSSNKFNNQITSPSTSSPNNSALNAKTDIGNMNVDTSQHNNMIPLAHGSDHHIHYSLPTTKNLSDSSASANMALNFSHDLLHQTSHHNQNNIHQHSDGSDVKPHLSNSFELDSGSLMQSAAVGMNMWRNTMNLNHFKHPAIADHHNFLPTSDLNSFPSWTHGNNLGHQSSSMPHHIIDSPAHLIGYSQHQRSLPISNQDLSGASIKDQSAAEQASFMLNSMNHQASTSQNSSSSHQTTQPLDNLNLRSHPLDHSAPYNLPMNDNQFYNSSRSESRSHQTAIKSSIMVADRSVHMSLSNHQSQLPYHNPEHTTNLQPTTSHHVAGTSSGTSSSTTTTTSKNVGSFRCATCNEVFSLRTAYQSHLKTHSQDKGSKAKFQCELCGHSFSQKTSLNRHMKSHTGERPFPCEICSKAFSEKERLKIHMRTHTGEKPFSCGICGKSFSQKSTVKRHQTVHTGEKKFRCDCGKGFANRGNLIAHIKTRGSNHSE